MLKFWKPSVLKFRKPPVLDFRKPSMLNFVVVVVVAVVVVVVVGVSGSAASAGRPLNRSERKILNMLISVNSHAFVRVHSVGIFINIAIHYFFNTFSLNHFN